MALKEPEQFRFDLVLTPTAQAIANKLNAALVRLSLMRASELNISNPFGGSEVAWKLAIYQEALLHRIVALVDGAAVAWNNRSTLSAILSARACMETFASFAALERSVAELLGKEDLVGLEALARQGTYASREVDLLKDFQEIKSINVLSNIDKFDRVVEGYREHYNMLSERCHPNSLGHHFMFAKANYHEGVVRYSDENERRRNTELIVVGLGFLSLAEEMMVRLSSNILAVAEFQRRSAPIQL